VRQPRAVYLTEAGAVLLAHARDVLERWDVGVAAVNPAARRVGTQARLCQLAACRRPPRAALNTKASASAVSP
jgi:DNA-binding transcriptional LysR family regulator